MAVLSPSPPSKVFACGMAARNFWLVPEGSSFERFASHGAPATTASEQSGFVGLLARGPNTLRNCSEPVYGVPSGLVAGATGLPNESTDAIVGLAPPVTFWVLILPGVQPDQ